jgi:putative hemolysin
MESPLFWLLLNVLSIIILAFYSMEEMAAVSFNRLRLQFYVSQGSKRASWLNSLLQNPSELFITTLIGVNVATFFGSECARKFHAGIGLPPDIAPLSQIILVIIFGELAPMFAARRYSEHVALMGIPVIYFSAKLLTPVIWLLGFITRFTNQLMGIRSSHPQLFLTQDELKKMFEDQDDDYHPVQKDLRDIPITSNIFNLREKQAKYAMTPLNSKTVISSTETVQQVREAAVFGHKYLVVYQGSLNNIIGIVYIKDLLRAEPHKKLKSFCSPPWFVSSTTPLIRIIKQFRQSSENIAIILDERGFAVGYLTFEDILEEIFGKTGLGERSRTDLVIDTSVNGEITLATLQQELDLKLDGEPSETLSDWMIRKMEHSPAVGESLVVPPCELTIAETSLLGITRVNIETRRF